MIGILEWTIRAADTTLTVTAGSINIDDQNIPAITADIVVPFDQAVLDYLDPRTTLVPRVTLTGSMNEWTSRTLSAVSSYAGSRTVADLSSAWQGLQMYEVSELFGAPLHSLANVETRTMSLDLHVREVSYDDWEMSISLASDEALLTDWAPTNSTDLATITELQGGLNIQTIEAYVDPVLLVILGERTDRNAYTTTPLSGPWEDIISWRMDMNGYELIRGALEDTNLKLRVNPSGRGFTLQRPENPINPPATHSHFFTDKDVTTARHVYSRSGDWYDSASLTQGDGLAFTQAAYPNATHSRTYTERFPDGTHLNTGMARNIVRRAANRGQFFDITAPIRLGVFMRDEFAYSKNLDDGTPIEQWIVKAVTYDLTSSTMNIRGEQRY